MLRQLNTSFVTPPFAGRLFSSCQPRESFIIEEPRFIFTIKPRQLTPDML
jgi:hypothetical protein